MGTCRQVMLPDKLARLRPSHWVDAQQKGKPREGSALTHRPAWAWSEKPLHQVATCWEDRARGGTRPEGQRQAERGGGHCQKCINSKAKRWSLCPSGGAGPQLSLAHENKVQMKVTVIQSCLTLRDPMDGSSSGSSVHGILQARILKWVAIPFSWVGGCLPDLGIEPRSPALQADSLPSEPFRKIGEHLVTLAVMGRHRPPSGHGLGTSRE